MHIKMVTLRIAIIVAGIIAAAGVVPVVTAAASPSSTGTTSTPIKTNNFAGYVAPPGFTSAQATFKLPKLTCDTFSTALTPDIDLIGPEGLDSEVGAFSQCGGQWTTYFLINGHQTNSISANSGDTITVTASETLKLTELKIKDNTTGATNALSGTGGAVTNMLIGDEALNGPYSNLPPSRFTTELFSKVTVGGKSLGLVNATPANWVSGKTTWLSTGAIQGGNAFTIRFLHN
jgi:hypothetical protein